uniref:Uncharacterized protein n=1 Tax=Phlebotomus papatasi TaxID=29031 RepID=A0A1B0DGT7_PHLPP
MSQQQLVPSDSSPMEKTTTDNTEKDDYSSASWQKISAKRGRCSPQCKGVQPHKQSKISDYWLSVPTSNKYSDLEVEETSAISDKRNPEELESSLEHHPRPPPIFVYNVERLQPMTELLNKIAPNKYTVKNLPNYQVKIQFEAVESYRAALKALQEKNTEMHSYQIKGDKTFNVVLLGMHSSADHDELKEALLEKGHNVVNVFN